MTSHTYGPPAYFSEGEEQFDSEDNKQNEISSSELDEVSQPRDKSDSVVETQEDSCNIEKVNYISISELTISS